MRQQIKLISGNASVTLADYNRTQRVHHAMKGEVEKVRDLTMGELRFIDESTFGWKMNIYEKVGRNAPFELLKRMNQLSDAYKKAFLDFYKKRVAYVLDSVELQNEFDKYYEKINPIFYDINTLIGRKVVLSARLLNLNDTNSFLEQMKGEEIQGIADGSLMGIGVYNQTDGKAEGFGIVEIFPEYIYIHRVRSIMDVKEKSIWSCVLEFIKNMPREDRLPVYTFVIEESSRGELKELGLIPDNKHFMYEMGIASDLKKLSFEKKPGMNVVTMEDVTEKEVLDFLLNAPFDRFFQVPYGDIKADKLSGSIICKINDKIAAMLLIEDRDDFMKIPWFYYKEKNAMKACFYILKNLLDVDYDPDTKIVFLDSGKNKKELKGYFSGKITEIPIHTYKLT